MTVPPNAKTVQVMVDNNTTILRPYRWRLSQGVWQIPTLEYTPGMRQTPISRVPGFANFLEQQAAIDPDVANYHTVIWGIEV